MYSVELEKSFLASAKKLPKNLKDKLETALGLLQEDPTHPQLHLKPLHGDLGGFYAFRIEDHRVIIEFLKGRRIRVLEIDKRDKIYKKK